MSEIFNKENIKKFKEKWNEKGIIALFSGFGVLVYILRKKMRFIQGFAWINNHITGRNKHTSSGINDPYMGPWILNKNSIQAPNAAYKRTKIHLYGVNNKVILKKGVYLDKCLIMIHGNNNTIIIDDETEFANSIFRCAGDDNRIQIGKGIYGGGVEFYCGEGTEINVKDNCLFAHDIDIRTSEHPLYDEINNRANPAKSIVIEEKVWIGNHVSVLKGANIPQGCVVGNRSMVTHSSKMDSVNAVYVGNPVRKVRENIHWEF